MSEVSDVVASAAAPAAAVEDTQQPSTADSSRAASPNSNSRRDGPPKCKQCSLPNEDLFRDESDNKLYCEECWVAFYKKAPPAKARFGGVKEAFAPISDATVVVDEYYQPLERVGAPKVFVDKQKCGWSALLKSVSTKTGIKLLQLVEHSPKLYVLYSRTSDIALGPDATVLECTEFVKPVEAKRAFEAAFAAATANNWGDVKGSYTKFITKGDYTLPQDVKAARRAENESRTRAKEEQRAAALAARNKIIAEEAIANIVKEEEAAAVAAKLDSDDGERSPAEPPCTPATNPSSPPNQGMRSMPSSPTPTVAAPKAIVAVDSPTLGDSVVDAKKKPAAAAAAPAEEKPAESKPAEVKPAAETKPAAEAKPAEAKPAETNPAEAKPVEAKPAAAAAKPAESKPAVEAKPAEAKPAAPAPKPEVLRAPPTPSSKPQPAPVAPKPVEPKPAAAAAPTAAPAPAAPKPTATFDVEEEKSSSGIPIAAVAVAVVAAAGVAFLLLRPKRN